RGNPRLGTWLRVRPGGWVEVFSGKVELGQGILTALAQIVAGTLGLDAGQIRMVAAGTRRSPDEGVTSGSLSVQDSGAALRQVCTEARAIYRAAAAARMGVPAETLAIERGVFGGRLSYWDLADDALLDRDATGLPQAAAGPGPGLARIDLPDKVFGRPRFIHDMLLPGLRHGRMVRPPGPGATLLTVPAAALPGGVAVVRDGSLLGVVADTEREAEAAATALAAACRWTEPDGLPDAEALPTWLRRQPADTSHLAHGTRTADSNQPPVARTVRVEYAKPYLAHASIGPSCAIARWDGERDDATLAVWSHTQSIFNLRRDLALALRIEPHRVSVQHVEGSGCYGHNPADDVAFDAAFLARHAGGRPVRVQWSRADELGWTPFSPAMAVAVEADLDAGGGIVDWRHTIWSNGHSTRPGRGTSPALLGAWSLDPPFERQPAINAARALGGGADRNAAPSYDLPSWSVTDHRVLSMPLRASAMRALGALLNVFAAEQMMDRLAGEAGADPLTYRLRHTSDPRARTVIELAARRGDWSAPLPEGMGRGIGYARYKNTSAYCAVVAEIEAAEVIRVRRLVIACDVGIVIDADGVANQMEGGAIQATSWVLKERVRFEAGRVTSTSWDEYPILTFSEAPAVSVHVVPSDAPSTGAGEGSVGPTAAAIANAVTAALGVPVRRMPLSPDHVVAAFDEQPGEQA
ncbi:MAG: molybdopterin cofactor-binding domain-containing protein, partial [Janthinobacterium lividum]